MERIDPDGTAVGKGEALVRRVVAAGVDLARLVAVRLDGTIHSSDAHALERAAIVAALLVTRVEAITAVENKYRGDFLRDVFLGRAGEDDYVAEHAQAFGWHLDRPVMVVVAVLDPDAIVALAPGPTSGGRGRTGSPTRGGRWPRRSTRASRRSTSAARWSPSCRSTPRRAGGRPRRGRPDRRGGARRPRRRPDLVLRRCQPGRRTTWASCRRPSARRSASVEIGRRVHGGGSVTRFDQLGLHRLLALVPDSAELTAFAADVLGPLAERTPEAADLRETLQVLLDTNFNVAEAARAQFFHYNTMRYRVGKLQRLLGPVATDPHLRLDVAVALRALEIVG